MILPLLSGLSILSFYEWIIQLCLHFILQKDLGLELIERFPVYFYRQTLDWMKGTGAIVHVPFLTVSYLYKKSINKAMDQH